MTTEYVSDIPYVHTAHREVSPLWIRTVLATLGRSAPAADGLRVCDLGCGTGLSAALAAASEPGAIVHGYDGSAEHVAHARALAEEAGLANLVVEQADFRALAVRLDLPRYDLVVVHGVLSWVAPAVRDAVFRFLDRSLAPGGVAYLHYASHPGASVLAAVQKALSLSGPAGARSDIRAAEGLRLLKTMREGSGLFVAHPQAATSFDQLFAEDPAFVAHEFMGKHWTPLYSGDVIKSMAAIGCAFAGSATPEENIDAMSLPQSTIAAIRQASSLALRETLKDIARDQSLRRDLYVRGGPQLSAAEHLAALRRLRFMLVADMPAQDKLVFQTRIGPVEAAAEIFTPVLERLRRGAAGFVELEGLSPFGRRPDLLNQVLTMLLGAGHIYPVSAHGDDAASHRLETVINARKQSGFAYPPLAFLGG